MGLEWLLLAGMLAVLAVLLMASDELKRHHTAAERSPFWRTRFDDGSD